MELPSSMKALFLEDFARSIKELKISPVPSPKIGSEDLVIRVTHVAPTHVDLLYAQGLHQNNRRHAKPPFIIGSDFAGIVVHSHPSSRFKAGQAVYGSAPGAFAEYIVVNAFKGASGIRHVPASWTPREACAVGASGAISLGAFKSAGGVRPNSWVLITGASGGLGVQAMQIAKATPGVKVICLAGSAEKAEMLVNLGANACLRYDLGDWETDVNILTNGEGVDFVYDAVGLVKSSLRCCRYGARVVIVGFAGRHGEMETLRLNRILLKGISLIGYRFGEHGRQDPESVRLLWREFDEMLEAGKIKPVVFPGVYEDIDSLPQAMLDLEQGKVWGRSVVTLSKKPAGITNSARL